MNAMYRMVATHECSTRKRAGVTLRDKFKTHQAMVDARSDIESTVEKGLHQQDKDLIEKYKQLGRKRKGIEETQAEIDLRKRHTLLQAKIRSHTSRLIKYAFPEMYEKNEKKKNEKKNEKKKEKATTTTTTDDEEIKTSSFPSSLELLASAASSSSSSNSSTSTTHVTTTTVKPLEAFPPLPTIHFYNDGKITHSFEEDEDMELFTAIRRLNKKQKLAIANYVKLVDDC